eukprot:7762992-Karenia_brevis.AAC.1
MAEPSIRFGHNVPGDGPAHPCRWSRRPQLWLSHQNVAVATSLAMAWRVLADAWDIPLQHFG